MPEAAKVRAAVAAANRDAAATGRAFYAAVAAICALMHGRAAAVRAALHAGGTVASAGAAGVLCWA